MRLSCLVLSVSLFALPGGVSMAAQDTGPFPPAAPPPLVSGPIPPQSLPPRLPPLKRSDSNPDLRIPYGPGRVLRVSVQPADSSQQPDREQSAQDGFVPISQLPPEEQLPAAPMLVTAYVVVVLALFLYLLSLSRRLSTVKQEIARLDADVRRSGRA